MEVRIVQADADEQEGYDRCGIRANVGNGFPLRYSSMVLAGTNNHHHRTRRQLAPGGAPKDQWLDPRIRAYFNCNKKITLDFSRMIFFEEPKG